MPSCVSVVCVCVQVGVVLADGVASEMLYRGVAIGALTGWLRDRAYEVSWCAQFRSLVLLFD
jgi:hypothetical protein